LLPKLLIFLPTYNEARNLRELVAALRRFRPEAHLLILDDASPDGTGAIADELARSLLDVAVIHRSGKLGLGSAHIQGMDHAVAGGYDVLVTMDCDFTHRPEDVGLLVGALASRRLDLVIGSRYRHPEGIKDWPMWRRAITRTAHLLTRTLLGIRYDATNAFRAYDVATLRRVPYREIRANGYSFMFEMVLACVVAGLRIDEVPVQLPIRQSGESKISRAEVAKAIWSLGRLSLARAPARLSQLIPAKKKSSDDVR
jgi:glycosyltransferase involved in cell wall biosynthesis